MKFVQRYRDDLVLALLFLLGILAVGNLAKYGFLKWSWFADNKNALDGISTVLGILAVAVGALATYRRFFKGRTFTTRADIQLTVSVHPHGPEEMLHAICLTVHNVGTLPIWAPTSLISVSIHGPEGVCCDYQISKWWTPHEEGTAESTDSVVDTGETASFYATDSIPRNAWSVTYIASVKDDSGNVWRAGKTVSNTLQ